LLIAEAISFASFGLIDIREIAKLESLFEELIPMHLHLPVGVKLCQDPSVFAEDIIDISHEVIGVAIQSVVVRTAALVRTEAFVRSAIKFFFAFQALLFHRIKL